MTRSCDDSLSTSEDDSGAAVGDCDGGGCPNRRKEFKSIEEDGGVRSRWGLVRKSMLEVAGYIRAGRRFSREPHQWLVTC